MAMYLVRACLRCNGYLGIVLREPETMQGFGAYAGIVSDATIVWVRDYSKANQYCRPMYKKRYFTSIH